MILRYGYFSLNKKLSDVWQESRVFWISQQNIHINKESSFATEKIAKLNLTRKRALKQSEVYYLKFVKDPNKQDITHVRICFEYLGDSLLGTETKMEGIVNNWILQFGVNPILFQKSPIKENEKIFIDAFEEVQEGKREVIYCPYCGIEIKTPFKYCPECGSLLDLFE